MAHAADALLLAVWFMLREIEFAAARTEDIEAGEAWVLLRIPLRKTAQGGEKELTARQLRCACGVRSWPMCPAHAAMRHVSRLKMAGFWRRGGPLFPDAAGATWAKGETVMRGGGDPHDGGSRGPPRAAVRRPRGEGSRGGVAGIQRSADGDHPVARSLVLDGGGAIVQAAPLAVAPEIPGRVLSGGNAGAAAPDEARRATAGGVAPSEPAQDRPRPKAGPATPGEQVDYSPAVQLVEAPPVVRGPGVGDDPTAREDLIYNEKGTKVHLSSSSGGLGAARGRMASGASSGCLRSRRPQPGAPVVSRQRAVETVKVHRPSRWTPRWRPARRLSRTAPRLRKERLRWSTGVPGGA